MRNLKSIKASTDRYDIQSRKKLDANITRKFKKIFGGALELFETKFGHLIREEPETYRELRSELLRLGNRQIENMRKELICYNITRIPFHIEFKVEGDNDE